MGMTEDEKDAKLKDKLADIIRDKGWNKNKTYDCAMCNYIKLKHIHLEQHTGKEL